MRSTDDRSTASRIRDSAIECFGDAGVAATTIRTIAERAEVSPGLVIHHFGSKDALRVACDQHIAATIREQKAKGMSAGPAFDFGGAVAAAADGPPITAYLARTLTDGSPHGLEMVAEMVRDAVDYTEAGVQAGMLTPADDPHARAAVLTIWSLGALVLHEHLGNVLGVDVLSPTGLTEGPAATRYVTAIVDLMSRGTLTPEAAAGIRASLDNPTAAGRRPAPHADGTPSGPTDLTSPSPHDMEEPT